MKLISYMVIVALSAITFSCDQEKSTMQGGIDLNNMDSTANPADDFYRYVNGGWMDKTEIPSDKARWGSFSELREKNDEMTLALIDKALADTKIKASSDEGKVVTFFKTAMNTDKLNEQGIAPIQPLLDKIDAINTSDDVLSFMIDVEPYMGTLFGIGVQSDRKNSNVNALYLGGGNLGLPDRDYYMNEDADSQEKRDQYVAHVSRMLKFINVDNAEQVAKDILSFETEMASAMLTKEERRKPQLTYNPMTLDQLNDMASGVDWAAYFDQVGAKGFSEIIVTQPNYLKKAESLLKSSDIGTIKHYLKWVVINDAASMLTEEIDAANFDFYGTTLRGVKEQEPRNQRVLGTTNRVLGEALGKLYVAEYFPNEAKETAVEMVSNLKKAYKNRIDQLDWMTDSTKVMAQKKLSTVRVKIGYPDEWKDYSDLTIDGFDNGGSFYQNMINSRIWNFKEDIVKIGKDVDKDEWFMSPQTVNAYYNPAYNEIVFPAAILQEPFFDFEADPAVNYGGMGAVIGHEISHGFDDQGSQFDAEGNLANWWTDTDRKNFEERGGKLVAQYDGYEPLPGVNVNGAFTLGENIGDLGGVNAAYDALQLHMTEKGRADDIDGFTQEQRFFMNWATVWRTKIQDEALKNQIKTDPHSPGVYRATGPIVNVDAFYEAFGVEEGDKMYVAPADRVVIW